MSKKTNDLLKAKEEQHMKKLMKERKQIENMQMGRLNRQMDIIKMKKMRDQSLIQGEIEEEVEGVYTVKENEDGEIEVEKEE